MEPIYISNYTYDLPDERIAKYPLENRDFSKLLVYSPEKSISHRVFSELPELINPGDMIIFNNTKVVPARMHFQKATGAIIEIFALEPYSPKEYNLIFEAQHTCTWKCIVGNAKKWKEGEISLYNHSQNAKITALNLKATQISKDGNSAIIQFTWETDARFSEVLDTVGSIPIPPYLNRDTEEIDLTRYQTTYALYRGSVAAPTAGLHFTSAELDALKEKGVSLQNVCLHVGAGTFLPVKSQNALEHRMHAETVQVKKDFLLNLISQLEKTDKNIVAVGTTSVRTLESLYYVGENISESGEPGIVEQWSPYEKEHKLSTIESLQTIVRYMETRGQEEISFATRIIIVPGFKFRIVSRLVTNFHQPQSTLLLLIAAFVGEEWREIYKYALANDFRFLSYGDSSFLCRKSGQLNII